MKKRAYLVKRGGILGRGRGYWTAESQDVQDWTAQDIGFILDVFNK